MIIGIGTDIIEIARIEKAVASSDKFLQKMFTEREMTYFEKRNYLSETIAGTFAVKEAVSKVFGTGIRGFRWTDIEVLRNELGKPFVCLHGEAKQIAKTLMITEIFVSISHSKTHAVAYCIGVNEPLKGEVKDEISD